MQTFTYNYGTSNPVVLYDANYICSCHAHCKHNLAVIH